MKIKWLGHAAFLVTAEEGVRIITDPYQSGAFGGAIAYAPIAEPAEIVLSSHAHADHGYFQGITGNPEIIKSSGEYEVAGVAIKGISTYHDQAGGRQRGANIVFVFTVDGVRICHLGDLGHILGEDQIKQLGSVDVLLIPVGGGPTIGASEANRLVQEVKPKITIPMHYATPKCTLGIRPVDDFLLGKENVQRLEEAEIELKSGVLPQNQIIVLKHAN